MENKKIFENPEAIIVSFSEEDIIVTSGGLDSWFGGNPGDEHQN